MTVWLTAADGTCSADDRFDSEIRPLLQRYCFSCHADGADEGSMSFDEVQALEDPGHIRERWYKVLRQIQAGLMPPADADAHPAPEETQKIEDWIQYSAFSLDPQDPDPGRVTIRRLNRVEYRNTVRDLLGVDYDTDANFPADDTGHGFDNIGDVLSLSPLLLEKYVNAATEIIDSTVPKVSGRIRSSEITGADFVLEDSGDDETNPSTARRAGKAPSLELSYYTAATARAVMPIEFSGNYRIRLNIRANESYVDDQFDENRCEFTFSLDGTPLLKREFVRQGGKDFTFEFSESLTGGRHELTVSVRPLTELRQVRRLRIQVRSAEIIGPDDPQHFVRPDRYRQFFPQDVPADPAARTAYARSLLTDFATRAFRRPVENEEAEQLVRLAEHVQRSGESFEAGIAKAMTAVLASPQFLFREERVENEDSPDRFPLIDEYSLASRLSYLFWSTMPDRELTELAAKGELRNQLDRQISRMLADEKSHAFFENFVGQWLRARALDVVQINTAAVLQREPRRQSEAAVRRRERFFALVRKGAERTAEDEKELAVVRAEFRQANSSSGPRFELTEEVRTAMRRETEMLFQHIVRNDRPLWELLDSDYTFLNQTLAEHYEIPGVDPVTGDEMRLVPLPVDSLRGGVLTQGTTLVVTSNPDRTSPVKRGLFVLENLLGTPPPAPPPNIPALEDVSAEEDLSLRETLAVHRSNALCSSCHNQMDPLGLALENFNALGRFRTEELDEAVDASGILTTGESFQNVRQLKKVLVENRRTQFCRCVTEKLMTYALGRAVEYYDSHTVDELVARTESSGGKPSVLISGIIRSSAFQRTRTRPTPTVTETTRADTTGPDTTGPDTTGPDTTR